MDLDLTRTLLATQNPDRIVRQQAEVMLKKLEESHFRKYITLLCDELSAPNKPDQSVQLAGILLKNAVDAKNTELKKSLVKRWFAIPTSERREIRQKVLKLVCSPNKSSRLISSQVVAKLAAVELAVGEWAELGDGLIQLAAESASESSREGAFETIGYLCEEAPDYMEKRASALFELLCKACGEEVPPGPAKEASLKAMYQALYVADPIFQVEQHRNIVLKVIFAALRQENERQSVIAFDCLARLADLFYEHLHSFLADVLKLTSAALRQSSTPPSVQLCALEFWAALSEIEGDLQAETDSALSPSTHPKNKGLVASSLPGLAPLLLAAMARQSEADFEEAATSGPAPAAAACLQLVALCTRDQLVPHVTPFLRKHFGCGDWHLREAALCAMGVLMEGPSASALQSIVASFFDQLVATCAGKDGARGAGAAFERDTATWALARVCKAFGVELLASGRLEGVLKVVMERLRDRPKVAANCCWALHSLAESAGSSGGEHNALTPYFDALCGALLECSRREDSDEHHLMFCCYETVNSLILSSAFKSIDTVTKLSALFTSELKNSFSVANKNQVEVNNFQALLIGSLSTIIKILPHEKVAENLEDIVAIFFAVLTSKDKTIYEEVLIAIGVVIAKIGRKFGKFVPQTAPFLFHGLENSLGSEVCQVAVGIISDIFLALGTDVVALGLADKFVEALLQTFQNPAIERRVKPYVVTCFGDIALSLDSSFERYMDHIMKALLAASQVNFDGTNIEDAEFQNSVRRSIFEAYSMILRSISEFKQQRKFFPYADSAVSLIDRLVSDEYKDALSVAAALAFVGDFVDVLGKESHPMVKNRSVVKLLEIGASAYNESVRKSYEWASRATQSLSPTSL